MSNSTLFNLIPAPVQHFIAGAYAARYKNPFPYALHAVEAYRLSDRNYLISVGTVAAVRLIAASAILKVACIFSFGLPLTLGASLVLASREQSALPNFLLYGRLALIAYRAGQVALLGPMAIPVIGMVLAASGLYSRYSPYFEKGEAALASRIAHALWQAVAVSPSESEGEGALLQMGDTAMQVPPNDLPSND